MEDFTPYSAKLDYRFCFNPIACCGYEILITIVRHVGSRADNSI